MRNTHKANYGLAVVGVMLVMLLSSCASNDMYRSDYEICDYEKTGDCASSALQVSGLGSDKEYRLGFVEYDDQGQMRDRQQMNRVLNEYREIAIREDVMLVTFVHGWHHSAKPEDDNIRSFRTMLQRLSKKEGLGSLQQSRAKRKILGLYIGWRGDSITIPYLNHITFWDRKNTAHTVGQQGVTEVLLKLEEIVNVKAGIEEETPPPLNSRMVVIGHSFGGAVVYTSLQKILADRFVNSRRGKTFSGDAQGFGDLVVLMNPAFEALRYSSLYDLSQESCRGYFSNQLPRLAVLTSETDLATKYAFPAGRFFATLFESHLDLDRHYCVAPGKNGVKTMEISEGEAARHTIGHFTPYLTHRLNPLEKAAPHPADYQVNQVQLDWERQQMGGTLDFEGSQLVHLGRSTARNPYLNVQVDKALIDGHNDIWRDDMINFIRDLIVISTTPLAHP